jgi:hypothetical protein
VVAIMHRCVEVSEQDWRLSAAVMAVSDETRRGLVQAAEDIKRQRELDAGAARAVRSEGYEVGRVQLAMRAIIERLKRQRRDGMARNDLRTSLSTAHRQVFDSAIQQLAEDGVVEVVTVRRGTRYRLADSRQGGDTRQGQFTQFKEGGSTYQGGAPDNLISLENHRSRKSGGPKASCQKWFDSYLAKQRDRGHDTVEAVAVRTAGQAAGYSLSNLYVAANKRGLKGSIRSLTG